MRAGTLDVQWISVEFNPLPEGHDYSLEAAAQFVYRIDHSAKKLRGYVATRTERHTMEDRKSVV